MLYIPTEPMTLEVVLSNPLKVALVLLDVTLLWKFLPVDYGSASGDKSTQLISNESTAGSVKVSQDVVLWHETSAIFVQDHIFILDQPDNQIL